MGMVLSFIAIVWTGSAGRAQESRKDIWYYLNFESAPKKGQQVEGRYGKALLLPDDFMVLPNRDFNFAQYSILMWVKPSWKEVPKSLNFFGDHWEGYSAFFFGTGVSMTMWNVSYLNPDLPVSKRLDEPIGTTSKLPADWWQDGKWHHFAMTFDGNQGRITTCFDGQVVGDWKGKPFERISVPRDFYVGRMHAPGPLNLAYDEVIIFGRALTAEEVQAVAASAEPFLKEEIRQ